MERPIRFTTRNAILSSLTPADADLLLPKLTQTSLKLRQQLERPKKPVEHVYFIEDGMASVVANGLSNQGEVEVGVIGREGMTGTSVVLSGDYPTSETYMQIAGGGQRISADDLRRVFEQSASFRRLILRYVHAFMTHLARTALTNARDNIEARLARWLLLARDRIDGDDIPITHEFLSVMLGTTRPGVTMVLQALERKGLIALDRKRITISNRSGLIKATNQSYGGPEAALAALRKPLT